MTAMRNDFDVAIVGGGPAGTAAALTLLLHSTLRVVVVESSDYGQPRVGETVSPGLQPLLRYLEVWDRFVADEHLPGYSTCAAWGSADPVHRDFLFTGRGDSWHLDRQRFDRTLADAVLARGGALWTEARVTDCHHDTDHWQFTVVHGDQKRSGLTARFTIDASGKKAVLARRLGARQQVYDALMGVVGFYRFDNHEVRPQLTLVEACADGWWYSALLPGHRMVAAFMSDVDILRSYRVQQAEGWQALLAVAEHTQQRLSGGRLSGPLHVRPAHSRVLLPTGGSGWIATGDAAASFDPLSSMGIGHAVASGIHAARVAYNVLSSDGSLMRQYMDSMVNNFQRYLQLRRQYYLIEQRWADHPFWQRRHSTMQTQ